MTADRHTDHRRGLQLFGLGRLPEALSAFRKALAETDSAELWNDWAATQHFLGRADEAETGFRLALELDPHDQLAAANLEALLAIRNPAEVSAKNASADQALVEILAASVSTDENERSYFQTHLKRYIETLNLLPDAQPGQQLLELGAAFHHLTPALIRRKGYSEARCNDVWDGPPQMSRELPSQDEEPPLSVLVDNFDVQTPRWPYHDASFDVILFCEMLEHLHSDPLHVLAEINRIARPHATLLVTTPNLASCHSVEYALRGESPYVYGKFEPRGKPTDRHNREYTPGEVQRLLAAAGFDSLRLQTRHSWWQPDRATLRLLASRGESIALRGDNIFCLARKAVSVRERYPQEFYLQTGTQADRRQAQGEEQNTATEEISPALAAQNLLVIHEIVPHFDQSGSDLRLLDILKELRQQACRVTLLARDAKNAERYSVELEALGIRVIAGDPDHMKHLGADQPTGWSFEELLRQENFDAAILFHWFWSGISIPEHYLAKIRRCSPSTRIAVLTDDRHGERERRAANLSRWFSDRERAEDFESRELAAYRAADLLLYITESDRAHFRQFLHDLPMELLPLVGPATAPAAPRFAERSGVLFLGNFENLANRDALDWFLRDVWPLVRKHLPKLTLHLAGNACPDDVADASSGVETLGKIANLAEAFAKSAAFVSPIRVGTGINTKNLQALAHGLPVVTTSIGAEGLQLRDRHHALLADTPLSFADSVIQLCTQPGLWQSLSSNGKAYIAAEFSREHLAASVRKIRFRLANLVPKREIPTELFSYRRIEELQPEVLTCDPAAYRLVLRTLGYWQEGTAQLSSGNPRQALDQFRHIFTALRGALPDTALHRRLLADMAAAYTALGDPSSAARCQSEQSCLVSLATHRDPPLKSNSRSRPHHSQALLFSVVLPTFNRRGNLALSLAALAFQTLPCDQWEVIVVDDGSTDDTREFLSRAPFPFRLQVLHQSNQGAGAARCAGVAAALGEFILLCNDDTIASSTLLEDHLHFQRRHAREKLAILGHFFPSSACGRRALSFWINHSPFLFPQQTLKPGQLGDQSLFVTCNLSIRRQALLEAGNFDRSFRVAEDTEMGARLQRLGYRVRFEPSASATHEHSAFASDDLLRRAAAYGAATWHLFNKHPQLLGDGSGPFGRLQQADLRRIQSIREQQNTAAASGLAALRALDRFDMGPLWRNDSAGNRPVDELIQKVATITPIVYWHYLFESFLAEAARERTPILAEPAPQFAAP